MQVLFHVFDCSKELRIFLRLTTTTEISEEDKSPVKVVWDLYFIVVWDVFLLLSFILLDYSVSLPSNSFWTPKLLTAGSHLILRFFRLSLRVKAIGESTEEVFLGYAHHKWT